MGVLSFLSSNVTDDQSRQIPRSSFAQPAIQHAIAAVGSLHQSLVSSAVGQTYDAARQRVFAIQQYNKAISFLTNRADMRPSIELTVRCAPTPYRARLGLDVSIITTTNLNS